MNDRECHYLLHVSKNITIFMGSKLTCWSICTFGEWIRREREKGRSLNTAGPNKDWAVSIMVSY